MNAKKLFGAALAIGLGAAVLGMPADVEAQGKKPKAAASPSSAPTAKKAIKIWPSTLAWGMSPQKVAKVYDKVIDGDFKKKYKKASPGIQQQTLDAEVAELKSAFRRSRIDFGKLPTGIDSTPLRMEYTYQNKESMMTITRKGYTRNFFFIQNRLWKIIDERKVGGDAKWGKDFADTTKKLGNMYGKGRKLPVDSSVGRITEEVDWRDSTTHLRVAPRGENLIYVIYEDNRTLESLESLRSKKADEVGKVDPEVEAILRKNEGDKKDPKKKK